MGGDFRPGPTRTNSATTGSTIGYAEVPYTGSQDELSKYTRRRLSDLRFKHQSLS